MYCITCRPNINHKHWRPWSVGIPLCQFLNTPLQLALLKPIFLSDCSLMARDNRRLMVRSSKHGTSVTRPWVILPRMQPCSQLGCEWANSPALPSRHLDPARLVPRENLLYAPSDWSKSRWTRSHMTVWTPRRSWLEVRMKSPHTDCEWNKNCARVWHQSWDTLYTSKTPGLAINGRAR